MPAAMPRSGAAVHMEERKVRPCHLNAARRGRTRRMRHPNISGRVQSDSTSTDSCTDACEAKFSMIVTLGNSFGEKYLLWIEEDNPKAKQSLKRQMDNLVIQLEEFGITYTEKYQQNKAYWAEKSSRHVGSENIQPVENNLLPSALAAADPYFYTGYAHDCWWILTCFEWNDDGIQLGENESGTRNVSLVSDHSWSEGFYKVTGSGLHVDFNFLSKLKHGSTIKQTVSGSDSATFFYTTVHTAGIGQTYSNPQGSWHYSIQYSVTNII